MSLALRTARTFWLKRKVRWSAVRPALAPAGDSLLMSQPAPIYRGFLPTRQYSKQLHKPAMNHECKNTPTSPGSVRGAARHRDSAPTAHTAERYGAFDADKTSMIVMPKLKLLAKAINNPNKLSIHNLTSNQ